MNHWTFFDYVSRDGKNYIELWLNKELSIKERTEFDELIETLRKMHQWKRHPLFKALSGKNFKGLGELRFDGDRKKLRVLGADRGGGGNNFVLLLGCTHKQNVYDPPSALETAAKRKTLLESGIGTIHERKT